MPSRGKFIVIEGLDRSGKSTQAERLLKRLGSELSVERVKLIKFPDRTTAIGKMIDAYLRSAADLDDHAIHLLFSANRWEVASSIIADLKSGTTIICDRYAFSGIAFSLSKGTLPFDWCQYPDIGLPQPDLVLFFDISPEVAKVRGGYGEERYEKEEMQRNVRTAFKDIISKDQAGGGDDQGVRVKWVEIDAGKSMDDVTTDVWRQVDWILKADGTLDIGKLWVDMLKSAA
ncbi:Thymidylate kinase [Tulasnella sp. JGI-2019a]|nr:Thymidylate kinase [Tulasnella sp. JGI-2019a]